jgi:hypothetical protein
MGNQNFKNRRLMEKIINYWGLADEYAVSKHKMEKGDHISKYERYEEVKEGYEAGFLKAVELFKTDKELMIKTFKIDGETHHQQIEL